MGVRYNFGTVGLDIFKNFVVVCLQCIGCPEQGSRRLTDKLSNIQYAWKVCDLH